MFMIHKIRKEILCIMICLKWHCKAQLMRIISILAGIIMEKKEKESIKMDISKRNAVRIVSFTVAVVGVLAVRNIQLMSSEKGRCVV